MGGDVTWRDVTSEMPTESIASGRSLRSLVTVHGTFNNPEHSLARERLGPNSDSWDVLQGSVVWRYGLDRNRRALMMTVMNFPGAVTTGRYFFRWVMISSVWSFAASWFASRQAEICIYVSWTKVPFSCEILWSALREAEKESNN